MNTGQTTCGCERPQQSADPRKTGDCVKCCRTLPAGWRNADFERDFLDAAERQAHAMGLGYAEMVRDRLTRAERQYGVASYLEKGLRGCLRETDEEALDLGGWPVLAALIANDEITDDDARGQVMQLLLYIAVLGIRAHQAVAEIEQLLS